MNESSKHHSKWSPPIFTLNCLLKPSVIMKQKQQPQKPQRLYISQENVAFNQQN